MTFARIPVAGAAVFALISQQAFSFTSVVPYVRSSTGSASALFSLIKGEAQGAEPFDENEGGVGLAKRTAVKIVGVSKRGRGTEAQELVRYDKLQDLDMTDAKTVMDKAGCQLLCSGTGKELYQDPGSSGRVEDRVFKFSPVEAAKDAIASASSPIAIGGDTKFVVVNFLGGDELIIGEVMQACDMLVDALDIPDKTKVKFNSISSGEIPEDICTVTVVASGGSAGGFDGSDESVARGEVYAKDGNWLTVVEGDITTASN